MINKQTTLDLNGPILSFTQQPQSVTTNISSLYTGNTIQVSTTYNSLPVRGFLYNPTTSGLSSSLDVVVLYHPTITSQGITPFSAAQNFLNITLNQIGISDKIIFSVAYPQDAIPAWESNPSLPAQQFPGIDYPNFYLGDNLSYAEAALLWVKEGGLDALFVSNNVPRSINKIFTFGHSQGGALVHKLNTLHQIDGVISNAPGPIDLLSACTFSEANGNSNFSCNKIRLGVGSTASNPSAYENVSLKNYLSGTLSPSLFTQALDDTTGDNLGTPQVENMQNIMQVGLSTCTNCNTIKFNYYENGGHDAFVSNTILQRDIRSFVGSSGGGSVTFVGVATATFPTQNPENAATNTGTISYRWYDQNGPLTDGQNVAGSASTTLTLRNITSPGDNGRRVYLEADHTPSAYSQPIGAAVTVGTARSTGTAFGDPKSSDIAILTVNPTISVTSNPSSVEVSEGDFATFTASGSSSDGSAVSYRWQLNGSYLSDNGSTVFGSSTSTLRISRSSASSNIVRAEISHPTASNSPVYTSLANFKVVVARAVINYEEFYDDSTSLFSQGSFDLTQVGRFSFDTSGGSNRSVMIYASEKDIKVRITLAGASGRSQIVSSYPGRGGAGGVTIFEITLRKNIEYVFKLGSEYNTGGQPRGGRPNGGGMSIFYRQSEVLVVSGGGGGSGLYGNGGAGGGAGQSGSPGETATNRAATRAAAGEGGRRVSTGSLGISGSFQRRSDGIFTNQETRDMTFTLGGKLSSCTYGRYWRNSGFSPCETMGFVQGRTARGDVISGSTDTVNRGYKSGLAYRNNGGNAGESQGGAGGGGAYGGNGAAGIYNYSGGGGGSGYSNGEATIISAIRGGNNSTVGYVIIELA